MSLGAVDYQPRAAERPVLYRVIHEHLEGFLETARRHADGASLPEFVEREFREFSPVASWRMASRDEPIANRHRGNPLLGLPPQHPTLPSLLRDAGYTTALIGKWHLGFLPHFGPLKSGYQEFFVYPLDGISLLPVLENPYVLVERGLFWRMKFRNQRAMRAGPWKCLSLDGDGFCSTCRTTSASGPTGPGPNRIAWRPCASATRTGSPRWGRCPRTPPSSIPYTKADLAEPS